MATYCFKCKTCGARFTLSIPAANETVCPTCGECCIVRDYRAENVGANIQNLKNERDNGGKEGIKRMFLPHNDDFKGPGDPDGTKGMRAWREEHQPRETNKSPDWPGYVDKRTF